MDVPAAVSTPVAVLYAIAAFSVVLIPGAVTLLKGRSGLFVAGFAVGGLVWMIVCFRLALPKSYWARWFYKKDKLARARERYPGAGAARPVHLAGAALMLAGPLVIGLAVALN